MLGTLTELRDKLNELGKVDKPQDDVNVSWIR